MGLWYNKFILNQHGEIMTDTQIRARKYTNHLIDLMDRGVISPEALALMALGWLSEADVKEMALTNDLLLEEDED